MTGRTAAVAKALAVALLAGAGAVAGVLHAGAATRAGAATTPVTRAAKPTFVIYYLWWTDRHWHDRLGPNYPYATRPAPLPASVNGCTVTSRYSRTSLTDVSPTMSYDQDSPATIERDVRQAASTGVSGFAVNWKGTGGTHQSPGSDRFNRRLDNLVKAVHKVNAEGIRFKLQLNYQASAVRLSTRSIVNDLRYFLDRYGADPALDHTYSKRAEMIWAGSWKYSASQVAAVSKAVKARMFLLGDEKPATWSTARAASLDGATYYWSSQNPYSNPHSFDQLKGLGERIHRAGKIWLAPFAPGYNAKLLNGGTSCVPRNDGRTMHALFAGNKRSDPDGWTFISWNEIAEGSHIVPLRRYGSTYLTVLRDIMRTNR